MSLPNDTVMLLSVVNTYLRDRYANLDAMCADLELDKAGIIETLSGIDYEYDRRQNQFV